MTEQRQGPLLAFLVPLPAAPAEPESEEERNLFDDDERRHYKTVVKHNKRQKVYLSVACRDGTLKAGCSGACKHQWVGIERFAPATDSSHTAGHRKRFFEAYGAYKQAYEDRNLPAATRWRAELERLRNAKCDTCSEAANILSPAEQACKDEWERMRKAACARNGGCAHQDCPERGDRAWEVLQADHGTNEKEHKLSHYKWWAVEKNGGVPAMREEAKRIDKWICGFCHMLEPTSASGNRCPDPETMPKGKQHATDEKKKQYDARHNATIRFPKHEYVDALKRTIGSCQVCTRPVLPEQEPAFHFDHTDEATKRRCRCVDADGNQKGKCHDGCPDKLFRRVGGVAGLVGNCVKAAALDEVRPLIDAEAAKCVLACANCHHRKTWRYAEGEEEED